MKISRTLADIAFCIALAALALLPFAATANNAGPSSGRATGFTENKGQVHDQFRRPNAAVLYLMSGRGMNVQLKHDGFSYDTYLVSDHGREAEIRDEGEAMDEPSWTTYGFHRVDIRFVNGDPLPEIVQEGESADYTNYYTDVTGEAGATFVRSYSTVTYRNVWPNIDVRFNSTDEGFKYDVIVRPGGDLADARFKVEGAVISESLTGQLLFTWTDNAMEERIPDSWTERGHRKSRVHAAYAVHADGIFGFVAHGASEGTLVIDPAIQWATYYGGSGTEGYASTAMDNAGNSYLASETTSPNNVATAGSHDAVYNSGDDGLLVKFSPAGVRSWGTYFGGPSSEWWQRVEADGAGNLALSGYTFSSSGIATAGAHKTQLTGTTDAYLMLFNTNGVRQWSTYYGGSGTDRGRAASFSMSGKIALVGETYSTNGIATTGAPDVTYSAGSDGFVAWFSATGQRLFGSYLGGTGDDTVTDVDASFANSEFVITGHTLSSSGIATAGSHDPTYNGDYDAYLALYNGSGSGTKTWCTYYGGSGIDIGTGVTWTGATTFVLCGSTNSTSGIATAGSDQPNYGGGTRDVFHASFDRFSKARIRGSYAGGPNEDVGSCITKLGNQGYAIGSAGYSDGYATPGSFGPTGPGRYVAGYTSSGVKNWAGYLPNLDLFSISIASNSTALVAAGANLDGGATVTPGAHQTTPGGGWDLVLHRLVNTAPPVLMPLFDDDRAALKSLSAIPDNAGVQLQYEGKEDVFTGAAITVTDALGREVPFTSTVNSGTSAHIALAHPSGVFIVALLRHDGHRLTTRFGLP